MEPEISTTIPDTHVAHTTPHEHKPWWRPLAVPIAILIIALLLLCIMLAIAYHSTKQVKDPYVARASSYIKRG